jgi:hypothetical protein
MLRAHPAPDAGMIRNAPGPEHLGRLPKSNNLNRMDAIRPSEVIHRADNRLLPDAKLLNNSLIAFGVGFSEVVEQAATLAHHHEKTAPGGMILLMGFEMFRQLANPRAQDGNLNLRRTGVVIGSPVVGNQSGFFLSG